MTADSLGYKIIVRKDDGTEKDVTEGVRVLYDHTVGSMDWGSGFFEVDDVIEVINVALTCGFLVEGTARETFQEYASSLPNVVCLDCGGAAFWRSYPLADASWYHGKDPGYRVVPVETEDHSPRIWPGLA